MIHLSASEQAASATTADLSIFLLGLPIVQRAGANLEIPRREVRALLYCLATRLEPVSREQLCFLFWPDTPESSAHRALSHLLTHLRVVGDRVAAMRQFETCGAVLGRELHGSPKPMM